MIELVFLGTSSMVPTKERNQSGALISYKTQGILVDCGEGTQRQFKIAKIPLTKVTKILITHWHGDHTLGLPGVIQTLGASEYTKTLEIYGPKGTKKHFEHMFKTFLVDRKIDFKVIEIEQGKFFENNDFILEAYEMDHGITTFGYNFIEKDRRKVLMTKVKKFGLKEGPVLGRLQQGKTVTFKGKKIAPDDVTKIVTGKKISIISDTKLCDNCYKMAKNADVLVCESTYSSKLEEKGENYNHMTAKQAALIANKANAKKLLLTHFSARYKTTGELLEDAKNYFNNTFCAYDFMKVKL